MTAGGSGDTVEGPAGAGLGLLIRGACAAAPPPADNATANARTKLWRRTGNRFPPQAYLTKAMLQRVRLPRVIDRWRMRSMAGPEGGKPDRPSPRNNAFDLLGQ